MTKAKAPSTPSSGSTYINSIEQFLNLVTSIRDKWDKGDKFWRPWFRGQKCEHWDLRPQIFRPKGITLSNALSDEEEFRMEFHRRGLQLVNEGRIPLREIEWYFLMQHYGAPTRLLDWTDGALMGLYFAVSPRFKTYDPDKKRDAAVWMLDPDWLNRNSTPRKDEIEGVVLPEWEIVEKYVPKKFEGKTLRRKYPIAVDPTHIARRLAVQRSRFTIHGRRFKGLEEVAKASRKPRLQKIIVRRSAVASIRKDLETCGISETTLFPDLAGLGLELKRIFAGEMSAKLP